MSATTQEATAVKPLFPLPLSEDFPEGEMRMDRSIPSDTIDLWGNHASWCQLAVSERLVRGSVPVWALGPAGKTPAPALRL